MCVCCYALCSERSRAPMHCASPKCPMFLRGWDHSVTVMRVKQLCKCLLNMDKGTSAIINKHLLTHLKIRRIN